MPLIKVNTGFGYYVDKNSHIRNKAELPIGEHFLHNDFDYVEVANKSVLDAIEVYQDPVDIAAAQNEVKIQNKVRIIAIGELIAAGELPPDFEDAR